MIILLEEKNWYETRSLEQAFIDYTIPFESGSDIPYTNIGYIKKEPKNKWTSWARNGQHDIFKGESEYDLIKLIGKKLPLKLKQGHWYKTRDGEKAFIDYAPSLTYDSEDFLFTYVCVGWVKTEEGLAWYNWTMNGCVSTNSERDIIELIGNELPR